MSNKVSFMRGDKASASVRVRSNKKQDALSSGNGQNHCKKRNRHSGDFSFFNHHKSISPVDSTASASVQESSANDNAKVGGGGGDWAYITFPNGVPKVQDIKTNGGPVVASNSTSDQADQVKVMTHQLSPNLMQLPQPSSLQQLHGSPKFPSDLTPTGNPTLDQINASFRQKTILAKQGATGQSSNVSGNDGSVILRNKVNRQLQNNLRHSRIVEEQITGVHLRNPQPFVTKVNLFQSQPQRLNFRRKSEQPPIVALLGGEAERFSGEFDFVMKVASNGKNRKGGDFSVANNDNNRKSGDFSASSNGDSYLSVAAPIRVQVRATNDSSAPIAASFIPPPSSGGPSSSSVLADVNLVNSSSFMPPQPHQQGSGLGRRAMTQIQIQQKKNGYVSAVCKSQENLHFVKVGAAKSEGSSGMDLLLSHHQNHHHDSSLATTSSSHYEDDPVDVDVDEVGEEGKNYSHQVLRLKSTVKKGLLWQQRDKLFSQWKERYFILTTDYLQCFKKAGSSKVTEMGEFLFKMKLSEVEEVGLIDKRGYLVISVLTSYGGKDGKFFLRKTEGIRDWYQSLQDCVKDSKRRRNNRTSSGSCWFWKTKQLTDSSGIENWLKARKKIGLQGSYLDPSTIRTSPSNDDEGTKNGDPPAPPSKSNRLNAKSEITLDELSDLYLYEELEKQGISTTSEAANKQHQLFDAMLQPQVKVQMTASRTGGRQMRKISRLSLMGDLELANITNGSHHLCIDLEKGIFSSSSRNKTKSGSGLIDNESNDSGNNSMNTNGSVGSSNSSHTSNPRYKEERLETHMESDLQDAGDEGNESLIKTSPQKDVEPITVKTTCRTSSSSKTSPTNSSSSSSSSTSSTKNASIEAAAARYDRSSNVGTTPCHHKYTGRMKANGLINLRNASRKTTSNHNSDGGSSAVHKNSGNCGNERQSRRSQMPQRIQVTHV